MLNEMLKKGEYSVHKNTLHLLKTIDLTSYSTCGWVKNLQSIGIKKGPIFLRKLGYKTGEAAAKEYINATDDRDLIKAIAACGFGIMEDKGEKLIVLHNQSIELGYRYYMGKSMCCRFYEGAYNAFLDIINENKILLNEESCICRGAGSCIFRKNG